FRWNLLDHSRACSGPSRSRLFKPPFPPADELRDRQADGSAKGSEFPDVQPSLAAFDLRDQALCYVEPVGQLDLCDAGFLPHRSEQAEELLVRSCVERLFHLAASGQR